MKTPEQKKDMMVLAALAGFVFLVLGLAIGGAVSNHEPYTPVPAVASAELDPAAVKPVAIPERPEYGPMGPDAFSKGKQDGWFVGNNDAHSGRARRGAWAYENGLRLGKGDKDYAKGYRHGYNSGYVNVPK